VLAMIVTFFSNFLNHHQLPFCIEMSNLLGDGFKFVATEPTHQERLAMGYHEMNEKYDFCVCSYKDAESYNVALKLGNISDVVIIGSASDVFIKDRLSNNKLTFRYSERIFKKGRWRIFFPRMVISLLLNHTRYINKKLYMLCASAYTASDFAMCGAYIGKTYKWGYFPQVIKYGVEKLMEKKQHPHVEILWCGRFLEWKHPELAIIAAQKLKEEGYSFCLTFIGNGLLEKEMRKLTVEYGLEGYINFLGVMPPETVREHMEKSNIYLFTSDRQEGWGAVLNESMNSGCAVVASEAIGSVPFLIKHGENGLIFRDNDINDLYDKVEILIKDAELRKKLGSNAVQTMLDLWNPKVAARRLVEFCDGLLINKVINFDDGPCSKA
jgi:glycosyltransferase involved in cell wall biosynthesis